MDLSPKLLTEVRFREQWRGYKPEEVDEFLERVAAGLEETQRRLADALERASNAERRLLERSDADEVRRTLVLAQRTADTAMEEARAESDRLVNETEERCRELIADAEAQAARLDADLAQRRSIELGDLDAQRTVLQLEIEALREFVDGERARLSDALREQLDWFEVGFRVSQPPAPSGVGVPSAGDTALRGELPPADVAPETGEVPDPAPRRDDAATGVSELRRARSELSDALRRVGVEPLELSAEPEREATEAHDALADEDLAEEDEVRWRDDDPASETGDDHSDDPFLAELRRAVGDTEPLGPRDHQVHPDDDLGDDDELNGGFFRRGRRR